MKKVLLSLLLVSLCVSSIEAQKQKRRKKPKKEKGNHKNETSRIKLFSANSVAYA